MKRKMLLVLTLVCLCSLATAQNKISSTWTCPKADPNMMKSLDVGDKLGHVYALTQFKCTANSGEIAGSKEKEGTGTEFADVNGNNSSGHGTFVETLASGDKLRVSYTSRATMKNNQADTISNKWEMVGMTGKTKGMKGTGTCSGKGNPDGSASFTCTGTYTTAK